MVMVEPSELTVAVELLRVRCSWFPPSDATVAVTVAALLNTNPEGALKTMVPTLLMSPLLASLQTGPVKVVQLPPAVSAEMLLPPVAAVTDAAAFALTLEPSRSARIGSHASAHNCLVFGHPGAEFCLLFMILGSVFINQAG
jgi:hypothetical protein